jgi:Potassium-transporting ATPase A subunit
MRPGARHHHEPAAVLPVAERADLDLLLRQAGLLDGPVAVAGQHRAVPLQPRRLAEQHAVLETAVPQLEQPDQLLPPVLDDVVGGARRLAQRRTAGDPRQVARVAYVLTIPVVVLVCGSMSLMPNVGTSALLNHGMHGLTEIALAMTMLIGRFAPIVLALAIAGSLAGARVHARTRATLDTAGLTFAAFLTGVIVIVGGLIYFPLLILGPIGERIVG